MSAEIRKQNFSDYFLKLYEEFTKDQIELDSNLSECTSLKIPLFKKEHPEWTYEHIVAASMGYCKDHLKDEMTVNPERSVSTPRVRAGKIVKSLKIKTGLKVGHMGLNPMLSELPMKNPNTLQTKMEEVITAEASWLTAEEEEKRAKYARMVKKGDAKHVTLGDVFDTIILNSPEVSNEEILEVLDWAYGDSVEMLPSVFIVAEAMLDSVNTGLNNIIKINVTLASELVQPYDKVVKDDDDNVIFNNNGRPKIRREYHFKPYEELKKAIIGIDKLPVIIEHQDSVYKENTVGCIRNLRADDSTRSIKGIAYLIESKLPAGLIDALRRGLIIPVSIGFWARLGGSGTHLGEFYDFTQEGIILHHLAICLRSKARCAAPLCGLNVDSIDEKINNEIVFIKKEDDYFNIDKNNDKKETNNEYQKSNFEGSIMAKEDQSDAEDYSQNFPKDIEAFISSLVGFLKGTVVEDRSQITERILSALKDAQLIEQKNEKVKDSMDDKDLIKLIQDSINSAIQKKDEEIDTLRNEMKAFVDSQKEAVKQAEEAKDSAKYIAQIKKFSKINDAFLEGKSSSELKLLADAILSEKPSTQKPSVMPIEGQSRGEVRNEGMIKLMDGTFLTAESKLVDDEGKQFTKDGRVDFGMIFDSVNQEFDLSGISFIYPDQK